MDARDSKRVERNMELARMRPCFRPDGSFDFKTFITESQVWSGLLLVTIGLLVSIFYTSRAKGEGMGVMLVSMLCMFLCLSGGESIVDYINAQTQARDQRMGKK